MPVEKTIYFKWSSVVKAVVLPNKYQAYDTSFHPKQMIILFVMILIKMVKKTIVIKVNYNNRNYGL